MGIELTPHPVNRKRQGVSNDVRLHQMSLPRAQEIEALLDRAVCHYPYAYAPDVLTVQMRRAQQQAEDLLGTLQSRFNLRPPSWSWLHRQPAELEPLKPLMGRTSDWPCDTVAGGSFKETPLHLFPPEGPSAVAGFEVLLGTSLTYMPAPRGRGEETTAFAGRGSCGRNVSLTVGSPLALPSATDLERGGCAHMALMLSQSMPDHLDAAVGALRSPENAFEMKQALTRAYQPDWFIALEQANRRYHRTNRTVPTSAASLNSVFVFKEHVYFIHSGLNTVVLCGDQRSTFLTKPPYRPKDQARHAGAPTPDGSDLKEFMRVLGASHGLFMAGAAATVVPKIQQKTWAEVGGRTVLMSNLPLRSFFTNHELTAAHREHHSTAELTRWLLQRIRDQGHGGEIHISALHFPQRQEPSKS